MNALCVTVHGQRPVFVMLGGLLAVALVGPSSAGPLPPLPCSAPPQEAAIAFFEFIEMPGSESTIVERASQIFSVVLLRRESIDGVRRFVESAKTTYGLDRFDRPLSQRLAAPPQVSGGSDPGSVSVRLLALSPRGRIEPRVLLRCEDGQWKVAGFSYGPPASR